MIIDRLLKTIYGNTERLIEIERFLIVGTIAVIIQYASYLACLSWIELNAVVSTVISYMISFTFNFISSNIFTFHTQPNAIRTLSFTLSHMINLGLQTLLVAVFTEYLNPKISMLIAMSICIPTNFILVRFSLKSKLFAKRKKKIGT